MYESVLSPLRVGPLELRNRVVRTAHGTGLAGEDLIAYHEARARGGVSLSILGVAGVHDTSQTPEIPVHDDAVRELYAELAARSHRHGMKVMQQLWHGGSAYGARPGVLHLSASEVANPEVGVVPHAMTHEQIGEIVAAFGAAAHRVREGGLDGVEIHAAHSYLIGQFLSPALNHRDDEYGGSPEGRLRFLREVLAAVRREVGDDFPVGVRLVGDEMMDGGLGPEDAATIAASIEDAVDFIDVSLGGYWSFQSMLGTSEYPLGYELPTSTVVTGAVTVPTIVSGRIMTLDHANQIIASGQADLVSMVRALIADPDLVAKASTRREREVRPCIGSNEGCEAGLMSGRFGCVVNVAAGRERRHTGATPSDHPQTVTVVGGGPAGLETARIAAARGHRVTVFEQRRSLGGQIPIAASVTERADLAALVDWERSELDRLGVTIRLNTPVDPDHPAMTAADVVVVASGSTPLTETPLTLSPAGPVPGSELAHVMTSWQALGFGGAPLRADRLVVMDDTGTFEAVTVAQHLVARGVDVTLVTRADAPGAAVPMPVATMHHAVDELEHSGLTVVPRHTVTQITPTAVVLRSRDGRREQTLAADGVVLCSYPRPERGLSQELERLGIAHHLVGDVTGSTGVRWAMRTAFDVACAL